MLIVRAATGQERFPFQAVRQGDIRMLFPPRGGDSSRQGLQLRFIVARVKIGQPTAQHLGGFPRHRFATAARRADKRQNLALDFRQRLRTHCANRPVMRITRKGKAEEPRCGEISERGLLFVQPQSQAAERFLHRPAHVWPKLFVGQEHDTVIRVADKFPSVGLQAGIEAVQHNICQQWRKGTALGQANRCGPDQSLFIDTALQHSLNQSRQPWIGNRVLQLGQDKRVGNGIEK